MQMECLRQGPFRCRFPIFRLADAYLMYAECVVRGAGGSLATADM
jgi:hypothetical protein